MSSVELALLNGDCDNCDLDPVQCSYYCFCQLLDEPPDERDLLDTYRRFYENDKD